MKTSRRHYLPEGSEKDRSRPIPWYISLRTLFIPKALVGPAYRKAFKDIIREYLNDPKEEVGLFQECDQRVWGLIHEVQQESK